MQPKEFENQCTGASGTGGGAGKQGGYSPDPPCSGKQGLQSQDGGWGALALFHACFSHSAKLLGGVLGQSGLASLSTKKSPLASMELPNVPPR